MDSQDADDTIDKIEKLSLSSSNAESSGLNDLETLAVVNAAPLTDSSVTGTSFVRQEDNARVLQGKDPPSLSELKPAEDDPFPITSYLTFEELPPWLVEECLRAIPFLKLCRLRRLSRGFNHMILTSRMANRDIVDSYDCYNKYICHYDAYLAATGIPVRSLMIYEKISKKKKATKVRLVVREWLSKTAEKAARPIKKPDY